MVSTSDKCLPLARGSFQSAEETRSALHMARLFGMLFSGSGSAGHWNFVDLEELGVRELLGSCAAVIVSSADRVLHLSMFG